MALHKGAFVCVIAALAFCSTVALLNIRSADLPDDNELLQQTQLFIVPQANVLTGIGQKITAVKVIQMKVSQTKKTAPATKKSGQLSQHKKAKFTSIADPMHWSHAMLKVQQDVMKQILKQRKQQQTAAKKRAEASYRDKLSSSLSLEDRRTEALISREKRVKEHDQLQALEDTEAAQTHSAYMRQSVQARLSQISSERIAEQAGGAQTLHHYAVVGSQGLHHLGVSDTSDDASTPTWLRTNV
jgi:hypothetical protein